MTDFPQEPETMMNLKYIAMTLTSLVLVTAVAAVPAQQDARPRVEYRPDVGALQAEPQVRARSADLQPATSDDHVADVFSHRPSAYYPATAYISRAAGEGGKFAQAESALAHEADQLKQSLEHAKTDAQRSDARTKLAENLGKQFDLRQKRHGQEIEALETQVKKLKDLVRKRQESREDIISRRVDQVLREVDGLGW
jgi:hypothetical protein